jgi:DNA-binding transcriptional regulator YiaG
VGRPDHLALSCRAANHRPRNRYAKAKKQTPAKRKKTSSAKSQPKSAVFSALASLEPFSGKALVAAAQEGLEALKEKKTLRSFRVPSPAPLEPREIVRIRSSLNASQAVFASYLGVSKAAVVAWEYGQRKPSGAARKLLSVARKNPQILVEA